MRNIKGMRIDVSGVGVEALELGGILKRGSAALKNNGGVRISSSNSKTKDNSASVELPKVQSDISVGFMAGKGGVGNESPDGLHVASQIVDVAIVAIVAVKLV